MGRWEGEWMPLAAAVCMHVACAARRCRLLQDEVFRLRDELNDMIVRYDQAANSVTELR